MTAHVAATFGLFDRVQLGVAMPLVVTRQLARNDRSRPASSASTQPRRRAATCDMLTKPMQIDESRLRRLCEHRDHSR